MTGNFTRLSLAREHSALLPTSHRGTSFGIEISAEMDEQDEDLGESRGRLVIFIHAFIYSTFTLTRFLLPVSRTELAELGGSTWTELG